jgi:hypothetical protein
LRSSREKANDRNVATISNSLQGLLDGPRTTVFKNVVHATALGNLLHLFSPVGGGLVVNGVVSSVLLLNKLELLVGRRCNDSGGTGSLCKNEASDGNASRT